MSRTITFLSAPSLADGELVNLENDYLNLLANANQVLVLGYECSINTIVI